jgi:hypothetical protein
MEINELSDYCVYNFDDNASLDMGTDKAIKSCNPIYYQLKYNDKFQASFNPNNNCSKLLLST